MRGVFVALGGLITGILLGFIVVTFFSKILLTVKYGVMGTYARSTPGKKQVIGFLPYWLVAKSQNDYSDQVSMLTYFGLTVNTNGTIQKLVNEQEEEPGWHMLSSKSLGRKLTIAKQNNQVLSLLVFNADPEQIQELIKDPVPHAKNLMKDVSPIMKKYGFSDLNLDIESTKNASPEARVNFTKFVNTVKTELDDKRLGTLTVEITGSDVIKKGLIDPVEVGKIADYVVIMAYDYHYPSSYVTGAVAPIGGWGSEAEFDINVTLAQAYAQIPRHKIILGIPSYGYSWETIGDTPRSAVMPGSGATRSNSSAEKIVKECDECTVKLDTDAGESYVIYKDKKTGLYHQMFYPDRGATERKVNLAKKNNLGGLAVWALGYEGPALMSPLSSYKALSDITRL